MTQPGAPAKGRADTDPTAQLLELKGHLDRGTLSAVCWFGAHPIGTWRLTRWVSNLPSVNITPGQDQPGHILRTRFAGTGLLRSGRWVQAALALPADPADYWAGPKRKVFRNKLSAAEGAGITWRRLRPDEVGAAVAEVSVARDWHRDGRSEVEILLGLPLEDALGAAAFTPEGHVAAVSLAVASGTAAQVRWGLSAIPGPARWGAFAALVGAAYEVGVQVLLVGPMIGASSDDEYFERRLGFTPSNVRVTTDPGPRLA